MKKFIILGNQNVITYKEIFPYIKENELWLGVTSPKEFIQLNNEIKKFGNILWFTNVKHQTTGKPVILTKSYYDNPEDYPKYDNYDAINVDRIKDIPYDYDGVMGVPITFIYKYNTTQFQIIGQLNVGCFMDENGWQGANGKNMLLVNGKIAYKRVLIKRIS